MSRIPILAACAVVLGLALDCGSAQAKLAAAGDRCAPHRTERVRARSASAVVLLRRTDVLIGCSLATGRRRVMWVIDRHEVIFDQIHVRGTWVAYVVNNVERYDHTQWLFRDDATHAHRRKRLAAGAVTEVAVGPAGAMAYVTGGAPSDHLLLDRRGAGALLVDQGFRLRSVRFAADDRLTWHHKITSMTASITAPDRCATGHDSGTLALAVTHTATTATACWRATGATRTVTADQITRIAVGGSWLAVGTGNGQLPTADVLSLG
ncbi:MAG TPA: hypothetical protein VK501_12905 [Baekduia sp.]|uniref:hypothetical protein n=1 Tax=Baekduia sp. TaxID=2600305 RepID=UPI002BE002C6|nr:hypothetical protein [Baekduia sp.]HMJ34805.1 hypothetical protein [Baekduia sp.]